MKGIEQLESITKRSPEENKNTEAEGYHSVSIEVDGEVIGQADLQYLSKPFPHYQVSILSVEEEYQGQGYASKIMEFIENMLMQKGRAGTVVDAIDDDSPARGMYERRGWIKVPDNRGMYAFNLPREATVDQLVAQFYRYKNFWNDSKGEK